MKYLRPVLFTILMVIFTGYLVMASIYVLREGEPETWFVVALTACALVPGWHGTAQTWRKTRTDPNPEAFN